MDLVSEGRSIDQGQVLSPKGDGSDIDSILYTKWKTAGQPLGGASRRLVRNVRVRSPGAVHWAWARRRRPSPGISATDRQTTAFRAPAPHQRHFRFAWKFHLVLAPSPARFTRCNRSPAGKEARARLNPNPRAPWPPRRIVRRVAEGDQCTGWVGVVMTIERKGQRARALDRCYGVLRTPSELAKPVGSRDAQPFSNPRRPLDPSALDPATRTALPTRAWCSS